MGPVKRAFTFVLSFCTVAATLVASPAFAAKDDVRLAITAIAPSPEFIKVGPSDLALNTATTGVIHVLYIVNAFSFSTSTNAAQISLQLSIVDNSASPGTDTTYPLTLSFSQPGNPNVKLTASPPSFANVPSASFTGASVVTVGIQCGAPADDCPTANNSVITGNLSVNSSLPGTINTNVSLQVSFKLVHPTNCLTVSNFISDQDFTTLVDSVEVGVIRNGRNAGKVTGTSPFGQLSSNTLVMNTCSEPRPFDLLLALDPHFATNPSDNPGNAVFTSLATGVVAPGQFFDVVASAYRTPHGQSLCIENVTLGTNHTLLAMVHMGIQRGIDQSALPPSGVFEYFGAELFMAGTQCLGASLDIFDDATLGFDIK